MSWHPGMSWRVVRGVVRFEIKITNLTKKGKANGLKESEKMYLAEKIFLGEILTEKIQTKETLL